MKSEKKDPEEPLLLGKPFFLKKSTLELADRFDKSDPQ
jgi:hypothetical protein